jgi:ATP-dependent DNA ligase
LSPLIVEAVNHLKVRSCLIDGEVVCCDERAYYDFCLRTSFRRDAIHDRNC